MKRSKLVAISLVTIAIFLVVAALIVQTNVIKPEPTPQLVIVVFAISGGNGIIQWTDLTTKVTGFYESILTPAGTSSGSPTATLGLNDKINITATGADGFQFTSFTISPTQNSSGVNLPIEEEITTNSLQITASACVITANFALP